MINSIKISVFALLIGLLLFSCKEDETKVDIRKQAVGIYDVTVTITLSDGSEISESDIMAVSESGTNGLSINIDGEDEELVGVREAGNGLGFNYPNKTEKDDEGDSFQISGTQSFRMGDSSYDGRFISDGNEIELEVRVTYLDEAYSDYNYTMYIRGYKQ